jgi:mono/diheme cytochrome c family protein
MSKERKPSCNHVRTIFATLGLAAVGAVVVASGVIYSGVYDVSATSGHNPVVAWVLHSTYEQSLHRHAVGAVVPSDLMDDSNIKAGAELYHSTCAQCHGAPGETLSPVGKGILPLAPTLLSATRRNNPPIMFWVIKNGVKMTAMPAFGKTWDDKQIWQMTAFLNKGRGISAKEYAALSAGAGPAK